MALIVILQHLMKATRFFYKHKVYKHIEAQMMTEKQDV